MTYYVTNMDVVVAHYEAGNGTDEQNNVLRLGYITCKCLGQVLANLIYT